MTNHSNAGLRALMYGECCFETFRCIGREVFALEAHSQRLSQGLASFGLRLATHIMPEAIEKATQTADDCLVRVTVGGGLAPWGLCHTAAVEPAYWIQTLPTIQQTKPVHLAQVQWPFPLQVRQAKYTADYAMTLRALHILQLDPDMQPLICDAQHAQSTMTSNVMFFIHGEWLTPPSSSILTGIVRAFLLDQKVIKTTAITLDMLADVQAIALSNSGSFITPVASLNARTLCSDSDLFDQLWQPLCTQKGVIRRC